MLHIPENKELCFILPLKVSLIALSSSSSELRSIIVVDSSSLNTRIYSGVKGFV
jgi:hypothetical protein